jgi:hypothetical protein
MSNQSALSAQVEDTKKNENLDEELVRMLNESAEKVIQAWHTRGTHAENQTD